VRILFLASRDWMDPKACGGDLCTTDYARYLAAQGHEVTLLAARYRGSAREEVVQGVRLVRPGRMFFLALHALLFYLRHRKDFDAVYEEGLASARLPFLAPLYIRRPLVAIWYQVNAPIFRQQYGRALAWLLTWAERLILALHRRCRILALSNDRKQEIVAIGFPPGQVEVMPPLMLDCRPQRVPSLPREPLIVWLGKIRRYKCPRHAVEAMPEVVRRIPEARLVIAGRRDDEAYEAELLELAERLGVKGRVELRLNISEAEKWELLARAQALVVTSPVEGFGIVIVEANRCGTPIVATDGVPSETLRDGYNGLRVPFGDGEALSRVLVRLLSDAQLFETLSRNARRHAGEFSVESVGRRLEEVFAAATARAA
jgi:glycosyltransferase involved in cell wall biosynthesis